MKFTIITFAIFLFFSVGQLAAQDADDLLKNMDAIMFPTVDKQGKIEIILTDKSGVEKVREAAFMQSHDGKKLFKYTRPESQAGIATLSLPDGIMWMYMPAFGKPKKITMLAKSQAFTGTDFAYEDMAVLPYTVRYAPKLIETDGSIYHIIELTPLTDKSNYSKIIVSLDKANNYPIRMEYYDKGNNKRKEATYKYQKIGKYWNAERVVMTDLKKRHSTTIILSDVLFDQDIPEEEFSVEKLNPEPAPEGDDGK